MRLIMHAISILSVFVLTVVLAMPIAATDNVTGTLDCCNKWHWSGSYVYYRVSSCTLPAGFQPALDNAANKWKWPTTTLSIYKGADVCHTNWSDTTQHMLWYGTFPAAWGCPTSWIACTSVYSQGADLAPHHLTDTDTVWDINDPYTNTCPWWLGANPDIESVFLHEFGHWGTLGHTSDNNARMYGSYYTCAQNLAPHDINSMNAVYVH